MVPSEAIVSDRDGLNAAVYDDGVARLRPLEIAADNGAEVEIRKGLNPGDRVVLNPPANLTDGMRVRLEKETRSAEDGGRR